MTILAKPAIERDNILSLKLHLYGLIFHIFYYTSAYLTQTFRRSEYTIAFDRVPPGRFCPYGRPICFRPRLDRDGNPVRF